MNFSSFLSNLREIKKSLSGIYQAKTLNIPIPSGTLFISESLHLGGILSPIRAPAFYGETVFSFI